MIRLVRILAALLGEDDVKPGFAILPVITRFSALAGLVMLAGCMGLENRAPSKTVLANPAAQHSISSLAIVEIDGMPDAAANRLKRHLKSALAQRKINLVTSPEKAAYSIKGFASAASGSGGTTLVHIWDVIDKNGRRAHRIMGEEQGPVSPGSDPWDGVNSTMLSKIASALANDYSIWTLGRTAPARPALKKPLRTARTAPPLTTASIPAKPRPASSQANYGGKTISLAAISGAPGDGNIALAVALKSSLAKLGYKIAPRGQKASYKITGEVYIGPPANGKQELAIDWKVSDIARRQLGIINQRNRITARALDKSWGKTASRAAAAAASNIAKLLR